jgi:hypothetical protein
MSHDDEMLDATTGGAEIDDGVEEEQEEELVIGKQRLKLVCTLYLAKSIPHHVIGRRRQAAPVDA